jgi:hypothetical protein
MWAAPSAAESALVDWLASRSKPARAEESVIGYPAANCL